MPDHEYHSEIILGSRYRDKHSGFEGLAVVASFHLYSCERIVLEGKAEGGDLKAFEFDAARLVLIEPAPTPYTKPETGASAVPVRSTGRR